MYTPELVTALLTASDLTTDPERIASHMETYIDQLELIHSNSDLDYGETPPAGALRVSWT